MKPFVRTLISLACVLLIMITVTVGSDRPAWASFDDDRFDGNIFALYAGNGSVIPPKTTLKKSLESDKPTLLTLYTEDSKDCKEFASVISRLQAYYGKVSDIIAVSADAIPLDTKFTKDEPGYYFKKYLPQTVLFDNAGHVVFNEAGVVSFESIDDQYRKVFDLLPREESEELRRRPLNEVNASLAE